MPRRSSISSLALLLASLALPGCESTRLEQGAQEAKPDLSQRVAGSMPEAPVAFVANRGQTDPEARFIAGDGETSAFFTPSGLALRLIDATSSTGLRVDFVGARDVAPRATGRLPGVVSYFHGSPDEWVTAVPRYSTIEYANPWPGIDLTYGGATDSIKYELRLEVGADPDAAVFEVRGARGVRVGPRGRLRITTASGTVVDDAPTASQLVDGRVREVAVGFDVERRGNSWHYGFELGTYDTGLPLTIDPAILSFAGYIGGASADTAAAVDVGPDGSAYLAGSTTSVESSFPDAVGPDTTWNGGSDDAWVAKVDPTGASLIYAGYIGGGDTDSAYGIAVDPLGRAYVTGHTKSAKGSFPEIGGPDLSYNGADPVGSGDAWVAKVNVSGTALSYAGYIGGSMGEIGRAIAVDDSGAAYVAGQTNSTALTFPETGGPDLSFNGGSDAFIAKVAPGGGSLEYAGYVGGDSFDLAYGVAVDDSGAAYLTGNTTSTAGTFPETGGPDLTHNGGRDAFVVKVAAGGGSLVYAGYVGGSGDDFGWAIAVDAADAAYITGQTNSDEGSFPLPGKGPDPTYGGGPNDAFVVKITPSGSVTYSGYIGGTGNDAGWGIAVDESSRAYVTGGTSSSAADGFPTGGGPDSSYGGAADAFVVGLSTLGGSFRYAGYIGGDDGDGGTAIAVDADGVATVAGNTDSLEGTFPESVGPDLTQNGGTSDGFVARVVACTVNGSGTITGTTGDDVICGSSGSDTISGLGGRDLLFGLGGADTLNGGGGDDFLEGGLGADRATFGARSAVTVSLNAGTASGQGSDVLVSIVNVDGSDLGDTITGSAQGNDLRGKGGADDIFGLGGADTLGGGNGDDDLSGGTGFDTCIQGSGSGTLTSCEA